MDDHHLHPNTKKLKLKIEIKILSFSHIFSLPKPQNSHTHTHKRTHATHTRTRTDTHTHAFSSLSSFAFRKCIPSFKTRKSQYPISPKSYLSLSHMLILLYLCLLLENVSQVSKLKKANTQYPPNPITSPS